MAAEGIVGAGRDHLGQMRLEFADRVGRVPGRRFLLADDLGGAERRVPTLLSHPEGEGRRLRAIGPEVIEPVLGEIDDQPHAFRIRQDVRSRQHDARVLAGHPGIDALVCRHHLDITEAVGTREIEQRVLVGGEHVVERADHVAGPGLALALQRRSSDGRSQGQRSQDGGCDGEVSSP